MEFRGMCCGLQPLPSSLTMKHGEHQAEPSVLLMFVKAPPCWIRILQWAVRQVLAQPEELVFSNQRTRMAHLATFPLEVLFSRTITLQLQEPSTLAVLLARRLRMV